MQPITISFTGLDFKEEIITYTGGISKQYFKPNEVIEFINTTFKALVKKYYDYDLIVEFTKHQTKGKTISFNQLDDTKTIQLLIQSKYKDVTNIDNNILYEILLSLADIVLFTKFRTNHQNVTKTDYVTNGKIVKTVQTTNYYEPKQYDLMNYECTKLALELLINTEYIKILTKSFNNNHSFISYVADVTNIDVNDIADKFAASNLKDTNIYNILTEIDKYDIINSNINTLISVN